MNHDALADYLRSHELLKGPHPRFMPLSGGVSSDILLVDDNGRQFVVKQSLEKLRVNDDWHCDTRRNITEYEAIQYAGKLYPQSVPRLLHFDRERRLFVMEYLGEGFTPWKTHLLRGNIDTKIAAQSAYLLATLHSASWLQPEIRSQFCTEDNFFALRIEPYLLTTGERHPALSHFFEAEARRLRQSSLALVHGDWSAKNMLVSRDRLVILDWEVACFGDPAFDAAFFLNLIYLKSLLNRQNRAEYLQLMKVFRSSYCRKMEPLDALTSRIVHLILLLMLARIDGKSPVEYITAKPDKTLVRDFVAQSLNDGIHDFAELDRRWEIALETR